MSRKLFSRRHLSYAPSPCLSFPSWPPCFLPFRLRAVCTRVGPAHCACVLGTASTSVCADGRVTAVLETVSVGTEHSLGLQSCSAYFLPTQENPASLHNALSHFPRAAHANFSHAGNGSTHDQGTSFSDAQTSISLDNFLGNKPEAKRT